MSKKRKIISMLMIFFILVSYITPIDLKAEDKDKNSKYEITDELKLLLKDGGVNIGTVKKESQQTSFIDGSTSKNGFFEPKLNVFNHVMNSYDGNAKSLDNLKVNDDGYIFTHLYSTMADEIGKLKSGGDIVELQTLYKSTSSELSKLIESNEDYKKLVEKNDNLLNPVINRALFSKIQLARYAFSVTGGLETSPIDTYKFETLEELEDKKYTLAKRVLGEPDKDGNKPVRYQIPDYSEYLSDQLGILTDKYQENYNQIFDKNNILKVNKFAIKKSKRRDEIIQVFCSFDDKSQSTSLGLKMSDDLKELAEIPFDEIFESKEVWQSDYGKAIREMLVERLRLIYAYMYIYGNLSSVDNAKEINKIVMDSANKYMELAKSHDGLNPEELNPDDFYGLKYPLALGDTGSMESKQNDGKNMSEKEQKEVTEVLDKYPGIWDEDTGFTAEYKGLFAWSAAFTPFKTNINDGNNKKNLTEGELSLLDMYGSNRSVLYTAQGDHGLLKSIEDNNANSLNYNIISLAEFLQKAPKNELALFVRHEATRLVTNTKDPIGEITGVNKEPNYDKEGKEDDEKVEVDKEEGKEKSNDESQDKTPVRDIQNEIGAFKIGEKESIVFLGPFYISSGQYGKDIVSLDDASQSKFLKGEAWSKSNTISMIRDFLVSEGVGDSDVEEAMKQIEEELKDANSKEDVYKWYHSLPLVGEKFQDFDKVKATINKMENTFEAYKPSNIVETARKVKEDKLRDYADTVEWDLQQRAGKISGNKANINYVWMYNSIIDGKPEFKNLEDDMQKPLYIDFLGNITTKSGIVVVPAAANTNMYVSPDMIMANAMFVNSYPDIRLNEKDYFEVASKFAKRKYIMSVLNTGGQLRWYKPFIGDKTIGNGDEIFSAPLASVIRKSNNTDDEDEDEDEKNKFSLIDYAKDLKDPGDPLFKEFGALDVDSKIYINNGAVIKKLSSYGVEAINTKKISTTGGYSDWKIIKQLNQSYLNTEHPLHELKLVQLILSTQSQQDQLKDITLPKYVSETSMLKNNTLMKFFGTIFEGINEKLLSKMDKNFLMYTPTQDKLPLFHNSGMYTQRAILLFIIIAFIILTIRFAIMVISKQQYRAKPIAVSLIALILIGGFNLYLFNPLINLLFNKPAEGLLGDMTPIYVMEMAENSYKDNSPGFFSDNPDNDTIDPGDPSLTLEKLNRLTVKSLRSQGDTTGELSDALYSADLDQTKLKVQDENLYIQGRELKVDVQRLFDNYEISDVIGFNGMMLDVGVKRMLGANNYMPYLQFLKTISNRINKNSISTYPPTNRITYRKGMSKTTGRAQSYFNSVIFIEYNKVKELKDTLANQYLLNLQEINNYSPEYVRQKIGMNDLDSDMLVALKDPSYIPGQMNYVDGKLQLTPEQTKFLKKKAEVLKALDVLDARYDAVKQFDDLDNVDWLGIRYILGIEKNTDIIPEGTEKQVFDARWYPSRVRYEDGTWVDEDKTWERIKRINDDTKRFVIDKIAPISGNISDDSIIKTVALYAMMRFNNEFSTKEKPLYPRQINSEGLSNEFVTKTTLIPRDEIFISNYDQVSEYLALKTGWLGLALASIDRIAYALRMYIRIFLITIIILAFPLISLYLYLRNNGKNTNYLKGSGINMIILSALYIVEILLFRLNYRLMGKMSTTATLALDAILQIGLLIAYAWLMKNALSNLLDFGFTGLKDKFGSLVYGSPVTYEEYDDIADMIEDDFDEDFYNDYYTEDDFMNQGDNLGNYSSFPDENYGDTTVDLDTVYNYDNETTPENIEENIKDVKPEVDVQNKLDDIYGIHGDSEVDDGILDDVSSMAEKDIEEESTPTTLKDVDDREELIDFLENRSKEEEEKDE